MHKSWLDRRYSKLATLVAGVRTPGTIYFLGQALVVKPISADPLVAEISGKEYSFTGALSDKADLAVDGLLGLELIQQGLSCREAVDRRLAAECRQREYAEYKERRSKARAYHARVRELWGAHAEKVWALHEPNAGSRKVAQLTLHFLESGIILPVDPSQLNFSCEMSVAEYQSVHLIWQALK